MNWFAVLAHHASRTPDKAITVFEGETITYGEMAARAVGLAGGLSERGVGRGDVVALLSYNCPEFLETIFAANYLGAIAMPINWRLAAPRCATSSSTPEPARSCVTSRSSTWPTKRRRASGIALVRACVSPASGEGWTPLADLRDDRQATGAHAGGGRRRPPPDVHLGDHRAPQGRHDHPRQPGLEEPGPHRRVRLHGRRPRARLRTPLPRGCARPDDDLTDRGRCDHHHPSLLRSLRRRRRARAVAGDHRLAGAGHGQRDHGAARYRTA